MNTEKYNGWTNYETWNYALWLDDDQGSQEYWTEQAEDCVRAARMYDHQETFTPKEKAAVRLEEQLKDDAENFLETHMTCQNGWLADAVNAYLGRVNWYEIAEHFLADVEQEADRRKKS